MATPKNLGHLLRCAKAAGAAENAAIDAGNLLLASYCQRAKLLALREADKLVASELDRGPFAVALTELDRIREGARNG